MPFPNLPNPFHGIPNPFDPSITGALPFPAPNPSSLPQPLKDLFDTLIGAAVSPQATVIMIAYFTYLEEQAKGKLRQIPDPLRSHLQPHYSVDLSQVKFAENINTVHGQGITVDQHIYFPRAIDLSSCHANYLASDVHWLAHELEHCVQYKKMGGKAAFLTKYAGQIATKVIQTKSVNVHDILGIEKEADAKANGIIGGVCNALSAKEHQIV